MCSAAKMHIVLLCALCTMLQGLKGQKEFISVTGAISTRVFDKGGGVKPSVPLPLFPLGTERQGWSSVCYLYI